MDKFWNKRFLLKGKNGKSSYDKWQAKYKQCVKRSQQLAFVQHNLGKYGCLPIWVAVEVFDFGALSKLYEGLTGRSKTKLAAPFGVDGYVLGSWLRGLNFIRNMAAHHTRLWNCNILDSVSVPASFVQLHQLDNTRPFLYFCLIQKMLKQIDAGQGNWGEKFKQILSDFPEPENKAVSLEDMGAAEGWEDWSLWE